MGGQDDAAGSAGPVQGIEGRVVVGDEGIARVAEDRLDEVEARRQGAGGEEAHFHGAVLAVAWHLGADDGAHEEGEHRPGLLGLVGGEGQFEELGRRVEGRLQEARENDLGHRLLVRGNGQAALGDVEDAFGGALVVRRIVEDAVPDAVGGQGRRDMLVGAGRQGNLPGHAVAVEHEGRGGQGGKLGEPEVAQVGVEEALDPPVDGGKVAGEHPVFLAEAFKHVGGQFDEAGPFAGVDGKPHARQLDIDIGNEFAALLGRYPVEPQSKVAFDRHRSSSGENMAKRIA